MLTSRRMTSPPWRSPLVLTCLVVVTALAHAPALDTPFFASEKAKLVNNPAIASVSSFVERMLTFKGFVQRPLGLFTFTATFHFFGTAALPYFATNLAIHLACTILVYFLAAYYVARPAIPALIFGLHPLSTAVVVELFGRYYALATAVMLVALILLHRWDRATWLTKRSLAILGLLFLLMITFKQTLVFFTAIVGWLWLCNASRERQASHGTSVRPWLVWALAAAGIAVAMVFILFYALPFSRTADVSAVTFLQSQLGNFDRLAVLYLLPYRIAVMILYPFHPDVDLKVVCGAVAAAGVAIIAFRNRDTRWGFLLGAILIALVPTNSIFPKDQLVLKWRLYPSMVFVALLLGYALDQAFDRMKSVTARTALATAVAGYLAFMLFIDWRQNVIYKDELSSFEQMAAMFSDVPDGHMIAARECFRRAEFARALPHLRHARDVGYRKPDLAWMLGYLSRRDIGP
jgi:hypothetical protein